MIKKDISFLAQRSAVLLLLLFGISCSYGNKIEDGRFLGLSIGASKERVFAVLKDDLHYSRINTEDWLSYEFNSYVSGKDSGPYEQLVNVMTKYPKMSIMGKGEGYPEHPDEGGFILRIYFEDFVVSEVDAYRGESLGINVGMSRDDVQNILINNREKIYKMDGYESQNSLREVVVNMNNFSALDYERILSFDVWHYRHLVEGFWMMISIW